MDISALKHTVHLQHIESIKHNDCQIEKKTVIT